MPNLIAHGVQASDYTDCNNLSRQSYITDIYNKIITVSGLCVDRNQFLVEFGSRFTLRGTQRDYPYTLQPETK